MCRNGLLPGFPIVPLRGSADQFQGVFREQVSLGLQSERGLRVRVEVNRLSGITFEDRGTGILFRLSLGHIEWKRQVTPFVIGQHVFCPKFRSTQVPATVCPQGNGDIGETNARQFVSIRVDLGNQGAIRLA